MADIFDRLTTEEPRKKEAIPQPQLETEKLPQIPKPEGDIFNRLVQEQPPTDFYFKYDPSAISKMFPGFPDLATEPSIWGYYKFLHTPTVPAQNIKDFFTRVLPLSLSKTTVGLAEFPLMTLKEIVTDPLEGFVYDLLEGKETGESLKKYGNRVALSSIGIGKGLVDFVSGPLGLYVIGEGITEGLPGAKRGLEEMKRRWLSDPAGSVVAVAPVIKGLRARTPALKVVQDVKRFGAKPKDIFQRLYHKVDIQAPFDAVGAGKTGVAVKSFPSIKIAEQQRVYPLVNKWRSLKLTPKEGRLATLRAANTLKEGQVSAKVELAATYWNLYKDQAFKRLQKDGVLKHPWPESKIQRNQARIIELNEIIHRKELTEPHKVALIKKVGELKAINENLKTLDPQYVHVPTDLWFGKIYDTMGPDIGRAVINEGLSKRFFKGRYFRERKTIDIGEMIDWLEELKDPVTGKQIFSNLDFDIRMIAAAYAQKVGALRGMARIFNDAKADGLVIPMKGEPPATFGLPPLELRIRFPELQKSYIHNAFSDYLTQHFGKLDKGMQLGRFFGYTKIMAFWNPFFLTAYDLWQMSWYVSPLDYPKMPKYVYRGIKSMVARDKAFYDASENAAFSAPFTPPFENFKRSIESRMEYRMLNRVYNRVKRYPKVYPVIDDFYKVVWNMAWTGDHAIRLMGYHYLRDKGYSKVEAAQTCGYFHGDYARFTPGARQVWNKILFTPSFKYAMGHVQVNMFRGAINVMTEASKLKIPKQRDLMMARGLTMLIAGELAKDKLMEWWGFRTDTLGLRYYKDLETKEGPKELVIYWPDPNNTLLRQFYKWTTWPADPDKIDTFMNKAHWDLHPLWQLAYEIVKNKRPDFTPVYNIFDSDGKGPLPSPEIAWDILHHSISRIVAAEGALEKMTVQDTPRTAYKALYDDLGKVRSSFLSIVTLNYLREGKDIRKLRRARELQSLFKGFFRLDPPEDDETAQRRLDNFFKRMNRIWEEGEEEIISPKEPTEKPKGYFERIKEEAMPMP